MAPPTDIAHPQAHHPPMAALARDPRHYQILVLTVLALAGLAALGLEFRPGIVATLLIASLAVQYAGDRLVAGRPWDPRSALISGLSLCLLLRTDCLPLALAAPVLAIASKFLMRWGGKHFFNPTNFALVVLLLCSDRVWVSPGQWGHWILFSLCALGLGAVVLSRARRLDISLAFLASYAGLLFARALFLGDPLSIPWHQLQNGSLLIFAFFMISDPRSTPDARTGRLLLAVTVSAVAAYLQFVAWHTYGLLYALALCAPLTPLLDRLFPARRYTWHAAHPPNPETKETRQCF